MRISVLTIGVIASIITTAAFANQVLTSQTYVDNQDALKQDKITAGTTGNVVLYNGTQNGQTQFSERAIYDDWEVDIKGNHLEDNLVTAGVLLDATSDIWGEMPELPTGTANTVVMYNNDGDIGGERAIYDGTNDYDETTDANKLITAGAVSTMAPELPTGNPGYAVLYDENGDIGGERGIYDGSTTYNSSTDANKLVTASVVQNASNNMPTKTVTSRVCTRWIDGQSHTDANCLLWNLVDETVYGAQCNVDADCAGYIGDCGCLNHMCDCAWD